MFHFASKSNLHNSAFANKYCKTSSNQCCLHQRHIYIYILYVSVFTKNNSDEKVCNFGFAISKPSENTKSTTILNVNCLND